MADDLETYLQQQHQVESAPLGEIERLTDQVLPVFVNAFLEDEQAWPYELRDGQKPTLPQEYTFSTSAMISFALSLVSGKITTSSLVPTAVRAPETTTAEKRRKDVEPIVERALDRLIEQSKELPGKVKDIAVRGTPDPNPVPPYTSSSTFGWDDPFTYNWLLEVLAEDQRDERRALRDSMCNRARVLVKRVLADPAKDVLQVKENEEVAHAFPRLRILQLRETITRITGAEVGEGVGRMHDYLADRIHRHLSESQMPDSGFDAADLVLSLEGWIRTSPAEPSLVLVERTFDALRESQKRTSYWRPLRPFKSTQQGLILLPQSVEVANSLLRICATPELAPRDYFSAHQDLLERYRQWLFRRIFRGSFRRNRSRHAFVGWESEHTHRLDRIHLWQTSQVMIFLQHYAGMLKEHVARKLLRLGNLTPDLSGLDASEEARRERWEAFKASDPLAVLGADSAYRVYEQIDADFVRARNPPGMPGVGSAPVARSGDDRTTELAPGFSMLLYGPPGTGKSRIAKELSSALGYRLLTVTPSDFITSGGEAVEARTKAIFTALGEQSDLVVLFDEIDHLLLDRNSKLYREQGDLFKLLTPGMLTKLNDLGQKHSVVFIIATNYFERIDRAIKRAGRIDGRYLVLPPCAEQRRRHLAAKVTQWETLEPSDRDELVKSTARFTYSELDDALERAQTRRPGAIEEVLNAALKAALSEDDPMASIEGYLARLRFVEGERRSDQTEAGSVDRPLEEFALLAYLDLEVSPPRHTVPRRHRRRVVPARAPGRTEGDVGKVAHLAGGDVPQEWSVKDDPVES